MEFTELADIPNRTVKLELISLRMCVYMQCTIRCLIWLKQHSKLGVQPILSECIGFAEKPPYITPFAWYFIAKYWSSNNDHQSLHISAINLSYFRVQLFPHKLVKNCCHSNFPDCLLWPRVAPSINTNVSTVILIKPYLCLLFQIFMKGSSHCFLLRYYFLSEILLYVN